MDWRAEKREGYGDTGWQMYSKIVENNSRIGQMSTKSCYKSQGAKYFKNTSNKKSFEIISNGNTVAAHFGRGSDLARVNDFMKCLKQWCKICRKILMCKASDNVLFTGISEPIIKRNKSEHHIIRRNKIKEHIR